ERCLKSGMDDFLAKPIQADDLWAAIDRIARTLPSDQSKKSTLLDAEVLLAACGGDPEILESICKTFRACLPGHMKAVEDALREEDAPRLRETAHKLCGMLAAFSSVAG